MLKKLFIAALLTTFGTFVYASGLSNKSDDMENAVRSLHSKDVGVRADARRALCKIAKESERDKSRIVFEVTEMLQDPALLNTVGGSGIWFDCAYLLGDLRAEEAMDV